MRMFYPDRTGMILCATCGAELASVNRPHTLKQCNRKGIMKHTQQQASKKTVEHHFRHHRKDIVIIKTAGDRGPHYTVGTDTEMLYSNGDGFEAAARAAEYLGVAQSKIEKIIGV